MIKKPWTVSVWTKKLLAVCSQQKAAGKKCHLYEEQRDAQPRSFIGLPGMQHSMR